MKSNRPQISILSHGFSRWGGGIDFLFHIASSLSTTACNQSYVHNLILPHQSTKDRAKLLIHKIKQALRKPDINDNTLRDTQFTLQYLIETFEPLKANINLVTSGKSLESQIAKAKAIGSNIVLPCISPYKKSTDIAWVGYLYDFQHRHLPEFFSKQEIQDRDKNFKEMLTTAKTIIVNSNSVAADAKLFFDDFPAKIFTLPFSPCPQLSWALDDQLIHSKYEINMPYFMICNQFWKHKDHITAILAFSEILKQEPDIQLICTGNTHDHRFPQYFEEIITLIKKLNITENIKILGHIPKLDQINLLKKAVALIQPTLFEGGPGGGAAYDAIALGLPVVASNIPTNLEMNCGDVYFFDAQNHFDLATQLSYVYQNQRERKSFTELLDRGRERRIMCGKAIQEIANYSILMHQRDIK